jgi:hypothetical protein
MQMNTEQVFFHITFLRKWNFKKFVSISAAASPIGSTPSAKIIIVPPAPVAEITAATTAVVRAATTAEISAAVAATAAAAIAVAAVAWRLNRRRRWSIAATAAAVITRVHSAAGKHRRLRWRLLLLVVHRHRHLRNVELPETVFLDKNREREMENISRGSIFGYLVQDCRVQEYKPFSSPSIKC